MQNSIGRRFILLTTSLHRNRHPHHLRVARHPPGETEAVVELLEELEQRSEIRDQRLIIIACSSLPSTCIQSRRHIFQTILHSPMHNRHHQCMAKFDDVDSPPPNNPPHPPPNNPEQAAVECIGNELLEGAHTLCESTLHPYYEIR